MRIGEGARKGARGREPGAPPTVFLHIGVPKSGTTYLQTRFEANHARAAAQGLLWPGPSWGRHVDAASDLRQLPDGATPDPRGAWCGLVREAFGWRGHAVLVSMEWMSELTPHQVRAAVESFHPAHVEVVCTARDLLRSFVAQGQEMAKNYRTWPWSQLEDEVLHGKDGPAARRFWGQQDVPRILRSWIDVVGPERVHLVTVPPSGSDPEVLWERFCALLGIDGTRFDPPASDNASLGVVSTRLMQRLNVVASRRRLGPPVYDRVVRERVAVDLLGPRRSGEDPIAVGDELDAFLRREADVMLESLRELGVVLHGDWDDLVPGPPLRGRSPEDVTDGELLDVCLEALMTLALSATGGAAGQGQGRMGRLRGRTPAEVLTAARQATRRSARRARGSLVRARLRSTGAPSPAGMPGNPVGPERGDTQ